MRILYHLPLSPYSRKVRIVLREKHLEFELRAEKVWERRPEFLALNPAGLVPVLVEEDGGVLCDSVAITEYIEETHPEPFRLLPADALGRAEVRRLVAWFDGKMGPEATRNLTSEKLMKRVLGRGEPNSAAIRAGKENLRTHMAYIGYLAERRKWLAGDSYSLADIAAAAQVSCVDYLGDIAWDDYPAAKDWYVRVKSRPSLRPLLADHIPGAPPPTHYADLDF
ncbi:MAG: glutathione S-transferase family protein [Alphaproteobacteria bacterium]|nr:glutathione S-transferase family protein [Alphaproteobacteria bacterium]